jgi:D-lactate dehydrogenase
MVLRTAGAIASWREMTAIAVFSAKRYDRTFLDAAAARHGYTLTYLEAPLQASTAPLAKGFPVVCGFVHDHFDEPVLRQLAAGGTRLVALRCAGFNNVDLAVAAQLGVQVVRVPAYSPHAVAEHTIGLMLNLDRKIHRSYNRVREGNFSLDGLLGRELHRRVVGLIGTGKIGAVVARILRGFDAQVLAHDVHEDESCRALGVRYVPLDDLIAQSEIVTLHCPLVPATRHLLNVQRLSSMRPGALLVNTSRGGLLDTRAVIDALKSGRLGGLALDVYEEEEGLFFEDHSGDVLSDDVFARLLTFPNVLVTGHQAFFTERALSAIAETTIENVRRFVQGLPPENAVTA